MAETATPNNNAPTTIAIEFIVEVPRDKPFDIGSEVEELLEDLEFQAKIETYYHYFCEEIYPEEEMN